MTIMSEEANDGSDVDIVLEEVSKIFRCKDCLRCYISYTKFAEHFPVYHPDRITTTKYDERNSRNKITPNAEHSRNFNHGRVIETPNNSRNQAVPAQRKISLEQNRLNFPIDHSSNISFSTNPKTDEGSLQHESSEKTSNQDNENEKAESLPHDKLYFAKRSKRLKQHHGANGNNDSSLQLPSEDNRLYGIRQEADNCTFGSKEAKGRKQPKSTDVEIITLSDSDDDENRNSASHTGNTTHERFMVKQEVDDDKLQETSNNVESVGLQNGEKVTNDISMTPEEKRLSLNSVQKNYSCQYCSKLFSRDRTLISHVKTMHRAEIEFEKLHAQLQQNNKPCNNSVDKGKKIVLKDKTKSVSPELGVEKDNKIVKSGSKKGKLRKRVVKTKGQKTVPVKNKDPKDDESTCKKLTFSCKWCPDKFHLLEDLKSHAINIHIKYKMLN